MDFHPIFQSSAVYRQLWLFTKNFVTCCVYTFFRLSSSVALSLTFSSSIFTLIRSFCQITPRVSPIQCVYVKFSTETFLIGASCHFSTHSFSLFFLRKKNLLSILTFSTVDDRPWRWWCAQGVPTHNHHQFSTHPDFSNLPRTRISSFTRWYASFFLRRHVKLCVHETGALRVVRKKI